MAQGPIGIYVHVPFCATRCDYCDFVSAPYDAAAAARYLAALRDEARAGADAAGAPRANTLYVGGGTPPVLGAAPLANLISHTTGLFGIDAGAEITVEANPETVDDELLDALTAAGVNRTLRTLARRHDAAAAEEAYYTACKAGIENVSIDLMYGLPGRGRSSWRDDVTRGMALKPNHISLYALTLEPHVPLARARGEHTFAGDDEVAAMYYDAVEQLTAAGYRHYEISNFARAGYECRHNLKYWRDDDYLAFGPGAASHWRGGRYRNPADLAAYCAAAATRRWPLGDHELSDAYREFRTAVTLALRLLEGVDCAAFERRFGVNPAAYYRDELAELTAAGLVEVDDGNIRLSRRGLFLSDEVFARLI
jgi:oxygen-independent coproporphyrinogen-3 oxidase